MIAVLLNWRVWAVTGIVVMLAVSHWFAYHQGGLSVQVAFERYMSEKKTAHSAALEAARAKEQTLQLTNAKVTNDYQTLKNTSATAAAAAKSERVRLLEALSAARAASSNTTTGTRADAGPAERILVDILGKYEEVAGAADKLADQVTGLQGYVRNVCVK
jgi:Protein of unknown function (DUF2514)